jgi:uncharacterized membrane protein
MMWSHNVLGWFWMLPLMLLFWGVFVAVIVLVVRALGSLRIDGNGAMQALQKRLAAGEISPDEYEKTKKLLQS